MSNFPRNLSILRRRAGYTQESLAEALNVSRQAVGKWESGQTMPEAATLLTLADLLNCTLDQLMREELSEAASAPADAAVQAEAMPQEEPSLEEEPVSDEEWEYQRQEDEAWAVFQTYDTHMNRFSRQIALGVGLILAGVGSLLAVNAIFGDTGLMVVPLLACIAAAACLFVSGGVAHGGFQKDYPDIPYTYPPEMVQRFRDTFGRGIGLAVGGIVADVALLVGASILFERDDTMILLTLATFMVLLGVCVGAIVWLGIQYSKYHIGENDRKE